MKKQITQTIGNMTSYINLSPGDANLVINIPILSTVGLNEFGVSINYNTNGKADLTIFGCGFKDNYFSRLADRGNYINVVSYDGVIDKYVFNEEKNKYVNNKTKCLIEKVIDTNTYYNLIDKYGNVIKYTNTSIGYMMSHIAYIDGRSLDINLHQSSRMITNDHGDKLLFTLTNNQVSKVSYYHLEEELAYTVITYDDLYNVIRTISYYELGHLVNTVSFETDLTYITIMDGNSKYTMKYNLNVEKVVSFIDGYNKNYENSFLNLINYYSTGNNSYTRLTTVKGNRYYAFYNNKPIYEIDEDLLITKYKYNNDTDDLIYTTIPFNIDDSRNLVSVDDLSLNGVNMDEDSSSNPLVNLFTMDENIYYSNNGKITVDVLDKLYPNEAVTCVIYGMIELDNDDSKLRVNLISNSKSSSVEYSNENLPLPISDFIVLDLSSRNVIDNIKLEIVYQNQASLHLNKILLIKKQIKTDVCIDESTGNILSISSANSTSTYSYNSNNMLTNSIGVSSNYVNRVYNNDGTINNIHTKYNTNTSYQYDSSGNVVNMITTNSDATLYESGCEYSSDGRFKTKDIDLLGNATSYTYDKLGKILTVTNALNQITQYSYNNKGLVSNITHTDTNNGVNAVYNYDSYSRLSKITLLNGSIYTFSYDSKGNITQVSLNNQVISKYTYDLVKGLIVEKINPSNNDKYVFSYNSKDQIKTITYVDRYNDCFLKYRCVYDDNNRLIKVEEIENSLDVIYEYNNNDDIKSVSTKDRHTNEIISKVEYEKNYSSLLNKKVMSGSRSVITSNNDRSSSIGLYPNALLNSYDDCYRFTFDYFDPRHGQDGIINYCTIGEGKPLNLQLQCNNYYELDSGGVMFWFKTDSATINSNNRSLLYISSNNDSYIKLYLNGSGISVLAKEASSPEYDINYIISSSCSIDLNKWNFVAFSYMNRHDGLGYLDTCEYVLNVNGVIDTYTRSNPRLDVVHSGRPIYTFGTDQYNHYLDGKIASLVISKRKYFSINETMNFYRMSKDYIMENNEYNRVNKTCDVSTSTTNILSNNTIENYEIYPLNNTITSLSGQKPIKFEERKSLKYDKDRTFVYNNKINRYAYKCDGCKIVYNTNLSNNGSIFLRVYTDEERNKQYIFEGVDVNGQVLGLYRKENNYLVIDYNNNIVDTNITLTNNTWHNVCLSFKRKPVSTSLRLIVDDVKYDFELNKVYVFNDLKLQIGRKYNGVNKTNILGTYDEVYSLYGQVEYLVLSSNYLEENIIYELIEEIKPITKHDEYDGLGFVRRSSIDKDEVNIITKDYRYKTHNNKSSTVINGEAIRTNNVVLSRRQYYYDTLTRLTRVIDPTYGNKEYLYDYRGYLTNDGVNTYTYDNNGNILSKNNTTYTYDSIIKDKLIKVGNDVITYNGLYPLQYKDITFKFEGSRLYKITKSGIEYFYEYDILGRRVKKIRSGAITYYTYENNNLVVEDSNEFRINYLYDEKDFLYGFILENKVTNTIDTYIYVRDVFNNILGIVDSNGSSVVKYDYSGYGEVSIVSSIQINNKLLGNINPIRYKGYYYDEESGLYYCNSRYYSSELCRFISHDSIEYLDPKNINGLNLYCYCKNNPIMNVDPSGHFAVSALTVTLSLLLATMISAAVVAVNDDNTNILGPYKGFSGPELSFSDKLRLSLISCDTYLAKKESKNRDSLNGYTYFKFLNAGLNIGFTKENKNKEKNKLLNLDLSIFEFGYSNDYFSISIALGLDPIDVSLDLENIFKLLF